MTDTTTTATGAGITDATATQLVTQLSLLVASQNRATLAIEQINLTLAAMLQLQRTVGYTVNVGQTRLSRALTMTALKSSGQIKEVSQELRNPTPLPFEFGV
jgi:hypothetical protein